MDKQQPRRVVVQIRAATSVPISVIVTILLLVYCVMFRANCIPIAHGKHKMYTILTRNYAPFEYKPTPPYFLQKFVAEVYLSPIQQGIQYIEQVQIDGTAFLIQLYIYLCTADTKENKSYRDTFVQL